MHFKDYFWYNAEINETKTAIRILYIILVGNNLKLSYLIIHLMFLRVFIYIFSTKKKKKNLQARDEINSANLNLQT